ncbi:MAG TPA: hypothetical protein VGC08_00900 [Pedobacter sp.]
MKIFAILIMLQLTAVTLYAQDKVKRFCEMSVSGRRIRLDYGQTKTSDPFRDPVYINKLLRVESFEKMVAAMNYMSDMGWKYEGSTPIHYSENSNEIRVLFSKEFEPAALTK